MQSFRAASAYVRIGSVILIASLCLVLGACSAEQRQTAVDAPTIQPLPAPSTTSIQTPQAQPPVTKSSQNPQISVSQSPPEVKLSTVT